MAPTLKASPEGLQTIRHSRDERGWTIDDPRWLVAASQILEPQMVWSEEGPFASGCSEPTWRKFLAGRAVNTRAFKAFCEVLGLSWEAVVDRPPVAGGGEALDPSSRFPLRDWDGAPLVPEPFLGREAELTWLQRGVSEENHRCLLLLGIGGVGKTALAVRAAELLQDEFVGVVWRSLQESPPLEVLLQDLLAGLGCEGLGAETSTSLLDLLLKEMKQQRLLLVLDGWEGVLGGTRAGQYRPGYEKYGTFLDRLANQRHQSSVLLTSRELPAELAFGEQYLRLKGLGIEGLALLTAKGVQFTPAEGERLLRIYRGNPMALKMIARVIRDLFNGNAADFLRKDTILLDGIERSLAQQTRFLSGLEQDLLCCLARDAQGWQRDRLFAQLAQGISESQFLEALLSLERRSLVEQQVVEWEVIYLLPPVVRKFVKRFYPQEESQWGQSSGGQLLL